ncbi:MAG: metalloregulator ArsR/SmtB family transcription factor [Streptosporangiales bacterium]|nr:metalloregulator ArsR/SmtB family transcription factor [Streptosporangiales bacterium]
MSSETKHEAKTSLLSEFARVGQALASPLRLELLDLLAQGERSVEQLAETAAARVGNTSAQLQRLRDAGLVAGRRDGTRVYYRLAGDDVAALLAALRATGVAHRAEADRAAAAYLGEDVEQVGREELLARARAGEVTVLDVRPAVEYEAGHIPGAISVPLDQLPARLDEIPDSVLVVAYCRGAYCVFAHDAVRLLHRNRRRARRLEDGFLEWKLAGLPVAGAG